MKARAFWSDDPVIIEFGVRSARLAAALRHSGYSRYLGVSTRVGTIEQLQSRHPELAAQFVRWNGHRAVLNNNADVLILSGASMLSFWRFRLVRHAQSVCWKLSLNPLSWFMLLGCLLYMVAGRCSRPRLISLDGANSTLRMFATRIRRRKNCRRNALHFIPHCLGLPGLFQQFDQHGVNYAVLRWFETLPKIEPGEDVDLLIGDDSLATALRVMHSQPGVQLSDVYSESGLARSNYSGTPYYPASVARRILQGAVRHNGLCSVPRPSDYFHSLAYHAVYHKGYKSGLPRTAASERSNRKPEHDYTTILQQMADKLGIDVEITLEGLHAYLQKTGWGPSPHMLARLAAACRRNRWLAEVAGRLGPEVHDQGLAVFVLRDEAIRRGFQEKMVQMISDGGFEIWTVKKLTHEEVAYSAPRTRGGNWTTGPFDFGGDPAVIVVGYDPSPIPLTRKQRRRFQHRTNARIFVKEAIRDAIGEALGAKQGCNALHSSDHAAEAWHLIEAFAPELETEIYARLHHIHGPADALPLPTSIEHSHVPAASHQLRRAA